MPKRNNAVVKRLVSKLTEFALCSGLDEEVHKCISNIINTLLIETKSRWIARDKSGDLYLYESKPERGESEWYATDDEQEVFNLPSECFSTITWKNEPRKIVLGIFEV